MWTALALSVRISESTLRLSLNDVLVAEQSLPSELTVALKTKLIWVVVTAVSGCYCSPADVFSNDLKVLKDKLLPCAEFSRDLLTCSEESDKETRPLEIARVWINSGVGLRDL